LFDRAWKRHAVVAGAALVLAVAAIPAGVAAKTTTPSHTLSPNTRFYVPEPDKGAVAQIVDLTRHHDLKDANLVAQMIGTPQAVWFNGGTPAEVQKNVARTVRQANARDTVPVLVSYNIPYRDCGQYSQGGALSAADYAAWIDGFAKGIGPGRAVVILEPDSLGLIPGTSNCTVDGPENTPADRFGELNGAVDRLEKQPNVLVYLDATHNDWQNVGDASSRLVTAGIQRAQGFYLNVSNFQYSANLSFYGTWISDCIAYATAVNPGDFGGCPNQYWNGGPATSWAGTGMSPYQVWSNQAYSGNADDLTWNTVGIDSRWASMLGTTVPTTHFVIDSSRNGLGPWNPVAAGYADKATGQDWCNPPARGVGMRPSARTGVALLDAYLWIKVPGESDGQCTRGTAGPGDPARGGITDPAAGAWFPQMSLELVQNANPAFVLPKHLRK
jgi:endoglucanase